jgi:pimeloyl-ACP methyl ester carboxylesterase
MGVTRFAQNELARLAYEVFPADHGPTVVLMHGTLLDRISMRPLQERMAGRATVLQPDGRGHGGSSALADRRFTVTDMAQDLYAVLEAAEAVELPVVLVGHGQGAIAALEFARIRPDLVAKMALVEPDALSLLDGELDAEVVQSREATRALWRAVSEAVYKGLPERAVEMYFGRRWGADWKDKLTRPRLAAIRRSASALSASLDALDRYRILPDEVAAIRVPSLVIAAETTPPTEQRIALRLREMLPQSEMITAADLPAASPFDSATLAGYVAEWATS